MASLRIIHFGKDECHRLSVLRSAGYAVEDCRTLHAFREALAAESQPDAVFITERDGRLQGDAVSLSKECSAAPLVLFRRSNSDLIEDSFDLVIDTLTPPTHWLVEIGALIGRGSGAGGDGESSETRSEIRPGSRLGGRSVPRPGRRFECRVGFPPGSAVFDA